jgi:hypothetical protein
MYLTKMSEGGKTNVTDIGGLEWDHVFLDSTTEAILKELMGKKDKDRSLY